MKYSVTFRFSTLLSKSFEVEADSETEASDIASSKLSLDELADIQDSVIKELAPGKNEREYRNHIRPQKTNRRLMALTLFFVCIIIVGIIFKDSIFNSGNELKEVVNSGNSKIQLYICNTNNTEIRTESNEDSRLLGYIDRGDTVYLIESSVQWSQINYEGKYAYVESDYIDLIGQKESDRHPRKGNNTNTSESKKAKEPQKKSNTPTRSDNPHATASTQFGTPKEVSKNKEATLPKNNTSREQKTGTTNQEQAAKTTFQYGYYTDIRDGKVYKTIKIGSQTWMAENLAYLPYVHPPKTQGNSGDIKCFYVYGYNGENIMEAKKTDNYKTYGVLYNWTAASEACPEGWHIPSAEEWDKLAAFIASSQKEPFNQQLHQFKTIGNYLKSRDGWPERKGVKFAGDGTDNFGLSLLPGGEKTENQDIFQGVGEKGTWWSSTVNGHSRVWGRTLWLYNKDFTNGTQWKSKGLSVRCVKD